MEKTALLYILRRFVNLCLLFALPALDSSIEVVRAKPETSLRPDVGGLQRKLQPAGRHPSQRRIERWTGGYRNLVAVPSSTEMILKPRLDRHSPGSNITASSSQLCVMRA